MSARLRYTASLLVVAACGGEQTAVRPSRPLSTPTQRLPGPGPQQRLTGFDAVAENEACVRCHAEIGAEWNGSLHRKAWDDEVFLAAYVFEPTAFCRRCHAPEIDETLSEPDPSRHLGVGCVTCHVLDENVLGKRSLPRSQDVHATFAEPRIASSAWCSGCHEFAFPQPQPALMQSTLAEHRESNYADRSCQECHMPLVTQGTTPPHRSHTFSVQTDAALLRSAVSGQARRSGSRGITVSLRVAEAGHAVPTGDLFRRLEIRAQVGTMKASPMVLAREFRRDRSASGDRRLQIGDTRLAADGTPAEVDLIFPQPLGVEPIHWQVVYQRMGPHEAMLFGVDVASEETVVASGIITAENTQEEATP
jgi:hypothetical protein